MQTSLFKILTLGITIAVAVAVAHASHNNAAQRRSTGAPAMKRGDVSPRGGKKKPPFAYAYTDESCTQGKFGLTQDVISGLLDEKFHSFKPIVDKSIGCSATTCWKGTEKAQGCQTVTKDACFTSTDPKNLCVNFDYVPCSDDYPCKN